MELIFKRTNFCEKSFELFSKFLQELIFAKKLTSNKSWKLNLANFFGENFTCRHIFSYEIKEDFNKTKQKQMKEIKVSIGRFYSFFLFPCRVS